LKKGQDNRTGTKALIGLRHERFMVMWGRGPWRGNRHKSGDAGSARLVIEWTARLQPAPPRPFVVIGANAHIRRCHEESDNPAVADQVRRLTIEWTTDL